MLDFLFVLEESENLVTFELVDSESGNFLIIGSSCGVIIVYNFISCKTVIGTDVIIYFSDVVAM